MYFIVSTAQEMQAETLIIVCVFLSDCNQE
jgi:hypothetical protein